MEGIFFIAILIMSVVIHEVSHGFVAEYYGDKTARYAGRLTLNPIKHLDLFGSVILPALLYFSSGFMIGWAKPVPYNPYNLRNKKWGEIAVAAAGICANFLIAIIFSILIRTLPFSGIEIFSTKAFFDITKYIVLINLGLGLFNLVPIPPLDGSKIFFPLLPRFFKPLIDLISQYSFVFLIIFIFFLSSTILFPILSFLFNFLTGLSI
jgi:Zn-dependent protease